MSLALDFAATIRGGTLVDDLATLDGFTAWAGVEGDESLRLRVVELRRATRSLFAHTVTLPPDRPDSPSVLDADTALAIVNAAAAAAPRAARLTWGERPEVAYVDTADAGDRLMAHLATAVIEFLGSEARADLRACLAPGCVRYFVKAHPQQQWCKPSCGNRARVSRHYQRTRE